MPVPIQPAGISVSIIDDDACASQVLSDWIRLADGFCLLGCYNTAEGAPAAFPNEKPAIVLLDLGLPDFSAFNYVRQLKPILQQTQFVMLVADENPEHIFNALAAGATGYLFKQTPRTELLAALKHIHAGGSPMSSAIAEIVLQSFREHSSTNSVAELSPRENRILGLFAGGTSYNDAAATLNITLPMVSTYIRSIYEKLQLHSAAKMPL